MLRVALLLFLGLIGLLACLIAVGAVVVHTYEMPNRAMEPLLHLGDRVAEIPVLFTGGFNRGSLVAFHLPYDQGQNGVGRVVGLPGDRIQVLAGHLIVNGKPVFEPYLRITPHAFGVDFPSAPNLLIDNREIRRLQSVMYGELVMDEALVVPEGYYFVLGDNRGVAVDSRIYGPVPRNAIFGHPVIVYAAKTAHSGVRWLSSADLEVNP